MRALLSKIFALNAEKPRQALLKGTALVAVAPLTLLVILVTLGELEFSTALYAAAGVFIIAIIFVWPYVNNLASLTRYVWALARDEKATAPDLSFLNNVEALTSAINELQATWERRRLHLETTIAELKRSEQVLSDFVANASHEIRTPLTSISGLIETLQTTAKDDPRAQEEFLAIMATQAERMTKLVNGLLSLSQIERNIHNKPTGRVHIPVILRTVQAQMSHYADERDMTINLAVEDDISAITGDMDEMTLVFENLVSNAIKYGHEGTDIRIRAREEENRLDEAVLRGHAKLIAVSVEDKGIGIEKKHLPRLTERFFRVDKSRSRKVQGTGLGLAIVKYILERHGGVMRVESTPGRGSTFTVYLPAEEGS